MENDDATAERISGLFAASRIGAADIVPWNAYPWYINQAQTAAQLERGVGPLLDLIAVMPKLQVVMLHGGSAHSAWRRLARRAPSTISSLTVIETYHTSRQAFWHRDPAVREQRATHLERAFTAAAHALS